MDKRVFLIIALAAALCLPLAAADAPAQLLITSFEGDPAAEMGGSWHGGSSSIAFELSAEQARSGAKSLKVTSSNSDYCGLAVMVPADKNDWTGYTTLKLWVFGDGAGLAVRAYIEEGGGEQFVASFADDFKGWKEISLPFGGFKSRTDYQASDAKVDRVLQVDKVKTVQFDTSSGSSVLYYDDISVSK